MANVYFLVTEEFGVKITPADKASTPDISGPFYLFLLFLPLEYYGIKFVGCNFTLHLHYQYLTILFSYW